MNRVTIEFTYTQNIQTGDSFMYHCVKKFIPVTRIFVNNKGAMSPSAHLFCAYDNLKNSA